MEKYTIDLLKEFLEMDVPNDYQANTALSSVIDNVKFITNKVINNQVLSLEEAKLIYDAREFINHTSSGLTSSLANFAFNAVFPIVANILCDYADKCIA